MLTLINNLLPIITVFGIMLSIMLNLVYHTTIKIFDKYIQHFMVGGIVIGIIVLYNWFPITWHVFSYIGLIILCFIAFQPINDCFYNLMLNEYIDQESNKEKFVQELSTICTMFNIIAFICIVFLTVNYKILG